MYSYTAALALAGCRLFRSRLWVVEVFVAGTSSEIMAGSDSTFTTNSDWKKLSKNLLGTKIFFGAEILLEGRVG